MDHSNNFLLNLRDWYIDDLFSCVILHVVLWNTLHSFGNFLHPTWSIHHSIMELNLWHFNGFLYKLNGGNVAFHHHWHVNVGLSNHLVHLFVCELLTQVHHHVAQLSSTDETISIPVEHLETLNKFLLCVRIFHLSGHQRQEFLEINGAVSVNIHFVDRILRLSLCRILTEGLQNCAQLLGGHSAISVRRTTKAPLPCEMHLWLDVFFMTAHLEPAMRRCHECSASLRASVQDKACDYKQGSIKQECYCVEMPTATIRRNWSPDISKVSMR